MASVLARTLGSILSLVPSGGSISTLWSARMSATARREFLISVLADPSSVSPAFQLENAPTRLSTDFGEDEDDFDEVVAVHPVARRPILLKITKVLEAEPVFMEDDQAL